MDVIVAHRLLKNGVTTSRAYLLLTDALLGWLGVDPGDLGLLPWVESYEHLGDVRCFLHPLDAPIEDDGPTSETRRDRLAAAHA